MVKKQKGIKTFKFRWFDDDPEDNYNPTIIHFGNPELKYHLLSPNRIIIPEQAIKIEFSYPLEKGAVFEYQVIGGFSRLDLAQCIYEGYYSVYADAEKYGVWGHGMGDLSLIGVEYIIEERYCMLSIVS
ncbi:hypothetical protein DSAG12_02964 [Promethearchaeum syntrophicum]|uniref:Uncharacterized protein n=1 Tax=Promethearchaeum syntrophicum TaxID=2594042 RepID=A0A5B9DDD3_9ARCH|nr:hypothetical protein [Candidatus Prometheoarchaeum syntrophicum]QEE17132.1 hypothetical protein DSAG12_02964 [Candidatus Prometheoarchaeum syntrophicum]